MSELDDRQREALHTKLLEHMVRKMADDKRGVRGPGLDLTDSELGQLLRITRARSVTAAICESKGGDCG